MVSGWAHIHPGGVGALSHQKCPVDIECLSTVLSTSIAGMVLTLKRIVSLLTPEPQDQIMHLNASMQCNRVTFNPRTATNFTCNGADKSSDVTQCKVSCTVQLGAIWMGTPSCIWSWGPCSPSSVFSRPLWCALAAGDPPPPRSHVTDRQLLSPHQRTPGESKQGGWELRTVVISPLSPRGWAEAN